MPVESLYYQVQALEQDANERETVAQEIVELERSAARQKAEIPAGCKCKLCDDMIARLKVTEDQLEENKNFLEETNILKDIKPLQFTMMYRTVFAE